MVPYDQLDARVEAIGQHIAQAPLTTSGETASQQHLSNRLKSRAYYADRVDANSSRFMLRYQFIVDYGSIAMTGAPSTVG